MKRKNSKDANPLYVLDTSVLIAYLFEKLHGDKLGKIIKSARLPFIVVTELYYLTFRRHGAHLADEVIQDVLSWQLPLMAADERISLSAGYLKGQYRLGIADSYIAALTLELDATLVTKDPDFRLLQPDLSLLYL